MLGLAKALLSIISPLFFLGKWLLAWFGVYHSISCYMLLKKYAHTHVYTTCNFVFKSYIHRIIPYASFYSFFSQHCFSYVSAWRSSSFNHLIFQPVFLHCPPHLPVKKSLPIKVPVYTISSMKTFLILFSPNRYDLSRFWILSLLVLVYSCILVYLRPWHASSSTL